MLNLNKKDFLSAYNDFKKSAFQSFNRGNMQLALENIEICAQMAYNFNFFYVDPDLEQLLSSIAENISVFSHGNLKPTDGKYAFIDTNGSDNHGLTQQYIRALISAEIEFIYIYEDVNLSRIKIIQEELKAYPKASIYTFDKEYTFVKKARMIEEILFEYKPQKYIMHIMPWDVVAIILCNILKNVTKYNINATDHAFWLGASCIDFNIEFRNYGYSVSIDKRGLREEQLLFMPYYPMINKTMFKGFPSELKDSTVKIFSGGSFYKVYGEAGYFFTIIKRLLIENPEAVLLYAGTGDDSVFKKFIEENNLSKRIFLLGNRSDIDQVFENCDIYLGTYPIGGGLMSQYAAMKEKPILAYTDSKLRVNILEGVVCHQEQFDFTFTDIQAFFVYANKLCSNYEFRITEGRKFGKCVITPEIFNKELKNVLLDNRSNRNFQYEKIDYDSFSKLYLEVENNFLHNSQLLIASKLRFKIIYKSPKIFINIINIILRRIVTKNKKLIYAKKN